MSRGLRWLNVLALGATLLSACLVLASDLGDAAYRRFYGDSLPLVVAYVALHAWFLRVFAGATPALRLVALVRAAAAWLFVAPLLLALAAPDQLPEWPRMAVLADVAREWMRVSPARYVYQVFDWGPEAPIGLYALVFLGRGAFNTVTAFVACEAWWKPLREQRPVLGRLVTLVPVTLVVTAVWGFFSSVRVHAQTWSPDAAEVAHMVASSLDCAAIREHQGQTTSDVRMRAEKRYEVVVTYGCGDTRVIVRGADGRIGIAGGPRMECCAGGA